VVTGLTGGFEDTKEVIRIVDSRGDYADLLLGLNGSLQIDL
jgi:hypothetical protein